MDTFLHSFLRTFLWWIIFIPVFYFIMKKFTPPGLRSKTTLAPETNPSTQTLKDTKRIWSFIAMRYYALILNQTFRVWVTDKYVCGAHEKGNTIASPIGYISQEWQNSQIYVDPNSDKKYKKVYFESDEFLSIDRANFRIPRTDIVKVDYYPTKWGMGRVPYSGRLVLITRDGKKTELILLGKQDSDAISKHLLQK